MAVRENVVQQAVSFLRDAAIVDSSHDMKLAFLRSRNVTDEEIDAALRRVGSLGPPDALPSPPASTIGAPPSIPAFQQQQQQRYGALPPRSEPSYGLQQAFLNLPPQQQQLPQRRDWRDWFVTATVVTAVGYGVYWTARRYLAPLVTPPTQSALEADKTRVDSQFERAFSLVEQLARDVDAVKAAEAERTQRLDAALTDLEALTRDLRAADRHRSDESQIIRADIQALRDSVPRGLAAQKELADARLRELVAELKGVRTLIGNRIKADPSSSANPLYSSSSQAANTSSFLRPAFSAGGDVPGPAASSAFVDLTRPAAPPTTTSYDAASYNRGAWTTVGDEAGVTVPASSSSSAAADAAAAKAAGTNPLAALRSGAASTTASATSPPPPGAAGGSGGSSSSFASSTTAGQPRAAIPAWQLAMQSRAANKAAADQQGDDTAKADGSA